MSTWLNNKPPTIAMPSGRRSSDPIPVPTARGIPPSNAAMVVIMIGRKRSKLASIDRIGRVQAPLAFPFQGEVDHHNAILFNDADQQDDADDRHHAQILFEQDQRKQCADAGRRQRGKDGDGMDEAFIEHAENDVYRDQGGEDQQSFIGQGILEGSGGSLKAGLNAGRKDPNPLPLY